MIENLNSVPPLLQSALKIFVKELESHLDYFDEILAQIQAIKNNVEPVSEKRAQEIQKKFHLIKGGAGFLGLREISENATNGEQLVKPNSTTLDFNKLSSIVETLRSQYNHLRSPH
jgi:chemotaxis protein histidine kinase CheA